MKPSSSDDDESCSSSDENLLDFATQGFRVRVRLNWLYEGTWLVLLRLIIFLILQRKDLGLGSA